MREICPSGSEGGGAVTRSPYPYRFMESLDLQSLDAHWDHEPKAPESRTHSKRFANLWDAETAGQRLEMA